MRLHLLRSCPDIALERSGEARGAGRGRLARGNANPSTGPRFRYCKVGFRARLVGRGHFPTLIVLSRGRRRDGRRHPAAPGSHSSGASTAPPRRAEAFRSLAHPRSPGISWAAAASPGMRRYGLGPTGGQRNGLLQRRVAVASALKNQARRGAVCEQSASAVPFTRPCRRADATSGADNLALGPDLARLRRDWANERNLEFERRLTDAFFEHRLDARPMQLSRSVAVRPPCMVPAGLRWHPWARAVTTTRPLSASTTS